MARRDRKIAEHEALTGEHDGAAPESDHEDEAMPNALPESESSTGQMPETAPDSDVDATGQTPEAVGENLSDAELNRMIEQLCDSKAEELRLLGYEEVSGEDVWACVSDGYRKSGMPPLYQVVNDILSLKPTRFMNYITLNMYRGGGL